jgi:hypothetical protein
MVGGSSQFCTFTIDFILHVGVRKVYIISKFN